MKYILNNHSYEGLAGETTDWTRIFTSYDEAYEHYLHQKKYVENYQDSFVQLFEVNENDEIRLLRAYYDMKFAVGDRHERFFYPNGEYIAPIRQEEDGECYWVRYDSVAPYNK